MILANVPGGLAVKVMICAGLLFSFTGAARAADSRPNLVLILADDLGYSDLGCFGGEIHTPNLDAMASDGLRMTQLYNAARCCSTRASLLTGLYPHQAGVGAMSADNHHPGYRGFLTDRCVTVASLLKEAGYRTYLSGKWHLRGKGDPECTPTNRGFDEFFGHFRAYVSYYRPDLFVRMPAGRGKPQPSDDFYATDAITDHAIDFVTNTAQDQPFFLYVAYNAPHFPLQAPRRKIDEYVDTYRVGWDEVRKRRYQRMIDQGIISPKFRLSARGQVPEVPDRNRDSPYYGKTIPAWKELPTDRQQDLTRRMATYAAMVDIMDENIGRLTAELRRQNRLENTLIVFLSDNGACAEWDPHGFDNNPYPKNRLYQAAELDRIGQPGTFHSYGTGWANACNTPFTLYKHYNHEGGISAPLIVHWPDGCDRAGQIDRRPAHVIDLAATFLEVGKARYPERHTGSDILPLEGKSLVPVFAGQSTPTRPLFFEHEGNRAVRMGKWKTVWTNYRKRWELYDISVDRSETQDLAGKYPERVASMDAMWHRWAESHFVLPEKMEQPAKGMPLIYYWRE